jgi:hypothetical protein
MSIKKSNLASATKLVFSTARVRQTWEKMTELTFQHASFADLHILTTGKLL